MARVRFLANATLDVVQPDGSTREETFKFGDYKEVVKIVETELPYVNIYLSNGKVVKDFHMQALESPLPVEKPQVLKVVEGQI